MSWIKAVLVGLDQLGNALAGGHPDATISARIGRFYIMGGRYWRAMRWIVDTTFAPIDGPNHCIRALRNEPGVPFQYPRNVAPYVLSFFVVTTCAVIAPGVRLAALVRPSWRHQSVAQ